MKIYKDMSEADYNALNGARSTTLSNLMSEDKTPAHVLYDLQNPKKSEHFIFGQAFHDYILRREVFSQKFAVLPEGVNYRTKEGKAIKAELEATYGDNLLDVDDLTKIQCMYENLTKNTFIKYILDNVIDTELTIQYQESGIDCKCRLDLISKLPNGLIVVVDLKTTASASERNFTKSIINYGYHIQSAHYLAGAKAAGLIDRHNNYFIHLLSEKSAPYLCASYVLDDAALEIGNNKRIEALRKYQDCLKNGWQGYPANPQDVALPNWYMQKQDDFNNIDLAFE